MTPKVSSPTSSAKSRQCFSEVFFEGITVFLKISDTETFNIARDALERVGATVMTELPYMADYIVSDKEISIPVITHPKSRGRSLVEASIGKSQTLPKVILTSQIPWIYTPKANINRTENIDFSNMSHGNDIFIKNMMVVTNGIMAPFFKELEMPKLFFGDVPKGYTVSPFKPIIINKEITDIQKNHTQNQNEPAKYQPEHSRNYDWSVFDEISEDINSKFINQDN